MCKILEFLLFTVENNTTLTMKCRILNNLLTTYELDNNKNKHIFPEKIVPLQEYPIKKMLFFTII